MTRLTPTAKHRFTLALGALALAGMTACTPGETPDGGTDAGPTGATAVCTEPADIPCEDEMFQEQGLNELVSEGDVTNTALDDGGFESRVDATAGGYMAAKKWTTYVKFTDSGLEKVAINDEDALESMDWDISFRRFMIRINSGNSGPSCVAAAELGASTEFTDDVTIPDDADFVHDAYYNDTCTLLPDGSGLGSAATALSTFWAYPGCVQMTGSVYVIRLASGKHVKFTVDAYYGDQQAQCQDTDSPPSGVSANMIVRWAFID